MKKLSQIAFQSLSLVLCRSGHCSTLSSQEFKGVFARSKNNQEKVLAELHRLKYLYTYM